MMAAPSTRLSAEDRRAVIVAAARDEFSRAGFAGSRTRTIAERAGVTEAVLYRHFAGKEELFEAAVAQPIDEAVQHIIERPWPALPEGAGTAEMRDRTLAFFRELLIALRDIGPLLGVVLFSDQERGTDYYRQRIEPAFDRLVELTRETMDRWTHRDFDTELVHRVVFGMCWMMAVDERLGSRGERDVDRLAEQLVGILFDGIAKADQL